MCGIVGIINIQEKKPLANALVKMTQSIKDRGPDNEGYVLINQDASPFYGNDSIAKSSRHIESATDTPFKVGFGFRQLKIIDLSNKSHQPMTDTSQNYWIVFNGEIYNYKEIREELSQLGANFFSDSDTEVLLQAYIHWGEKALDKLNGMFAFSIYDKLKNRIFFARDRVGIKPLYYYQDNSHFIFSSTQKGIIDSQLYQPNIDWTGLSQNFRFSIAQRPSTCFEGIKAVSPGQLVSIQLDDFTVEKKTYWQIPNNIQDHTLTEKQATNLLEEAIYKSVAYRMQADVEVGTFMSGGIDSTTLSVIAAKTNPSIKAMTLGFKDFKEFNEIDEATATAKMHGLQHHIDTVSPQDILGIIDKTPHIYEEPYFYLPINYVIAKIAKNQGVKVVLNGLGGDELFGGYDVFHKLHLWETLKKHKKSIGLLPNIHPKIAKGKQLATYKDLDAFYAHYYTNYTDNEIQKLFKTENKSTLKTLKEYYNPDNIEFEDSFEAISFYNLKSYIGNHQMRTVDQCTMHFSLEGRFPLLDHNLIEVAAKIPTQYKIKQQQQKYVLREVAKKHIHPSCMKMGKKGLSLPMEQWMQKELKSFVNEMISALKKRSLFHSNEIDRILKSKDSKKIWQLISTEMWLDTYFK